MLHLVFLLIFLFFFTDTATTEIYTLSLHDALPICEKQIGRDLKARFHPESRRICFKIDRKSTRLNSSHLGISYAVFCLKKKKKKKSQKVEIEHNTMQTHN